MQHMTQWSKALGQKPKGHWFKPRSGHLMCVVHLDKAFIYIVSVYPADIGYLCWELTWDGLVSYLGGVNGSHLLRTKKTRDKHQLMHLHDSEIDFLFLNRANFYGMNKLSFPNKHYSIPVDVGWFLCWDEHPFVEDLFLWFHCSSEIIREFNIW